MAIEQPLPELEFHPEPPMRSSGVRDAFDERDLDDIVRTVYPAGR